MKIAVPRERRAHERRVAATPETVKKFVAMGFSVTIEAGAGLQSRIPDALYKEAGATIEPDVASVYKDAALVLKVQRPMQAVEGDLDELALIPKSALLLGILSPFNAPESVAAYAGAGITAMALEFVPRITRAQSMDVLSSQSNLAGYKAVLDAAVEYDRAMPMMMTAAGTVAPAKVMVLGAGVAGLQAIATAKRLGAVVSATDVRPVAKEQVESLGGRFVMVESDELKEAETAGGYAKEMSEDFKRRQAELVAQTIKTQDIVICTALIPGRKAPVLVNDEMVASMRPGSIIVDLAVEQGGNCTASRPGEVVDVNGVKVVGHFNVPSRIAADASALYAKNLLNFVSPLVCADGDGATAELALDFEDEILAAATLAHGGSVVHSAFTDNN
ncbi:Re/Si-specific NAD(P)(+) transhydrogenase subunit alpha [Gilvimarinus sp. SDUM040013]|uniref:proton-translocating NAD(P)(+) transhydrogenase n=1 Tax=Gilvimarinus gilvus TaxID=3058038 RepID=A0ABU4RYB8_9GAMM|nr:Re/Si-specific NAD(P)(+) transhydrogenase subunit alpha [Gilvimarinus sp. SDUM040013]MDO3386220.1 Re/Si-specific NAD(P)(+) transhydrogenase subunit alpha [Gilvimarinus sp. SDUM040013]MDX6849785.1 Re/Si-specific NAD(P)(+) transhydrogenase subunit alpha [Gilvimarinus sp. SDUM040013]